MVAACDVIEHHDFECWIDSNVSALAECKLDCVRLHFFARVILGPGDGVDHSIRVREVLAHHVMVVECEVRRSLRSSKLVRRANGSIEEAGVLALVVYLALLAVDDCHRSLAFLNLLLEVLHLLEELQCSLGLRLG